MLISIAGLLILLGLYHSIRGEIGILRPLLMRDDLPPILSGVRDTKVTLRAAWHITSLLWFGLAGLFIHAYWTSVSLPESFLVMICAVFLISGVGALIAGRGRHPAWIAFLLISVLALMILQAK